MRIVVLGGHSTKPCSHALQRAPPTLPGFLQLCSHSPLLFWWAPPCSPRHIPIPCFLMPLPSRLGSKATSAKLLSQIATPRLSEALMDVCLLHRLEAGPASGSSRPAFQATPGTASCVCSCPLSTFCMDRCVKGVRSTGCDAHHSNSHLTHFPQRAAMHPSWEPRAGREASQ